MLDIFSRYPVGWRLEEVEDAEPAEQWMADLVAPHGRLRGQPHTLRQPAEPAPAPDSRHPGS
jgi:hypothetical protein